MHQKNESTAFEFFVAVFTLVYHYMSLSLNLLAEDMINF